MNNDKNFQKSTIKIKKCKDCKNKKCQLLYDHHHDEHFSKNCGQVIFQSLEYFLEYRTDPQYWEKQYQKRREKKQIKEEKDRIIKKLETLNKKITIKEQEIQIHNLKPSEETKIIALCRETHFKLIRKNITHKGQLKETQHIIKQKTKEEYKKEQEKIKKEEKKIEK